jgi:hypothetical protein
MAWLQFLNTRENPNSGQRRVKAVDRCDSWSGAVLRQLADFPTVNYDTNTHF